MGSSTCAAAFPMSEPVARELAADAVAPPAIWLIVVTEKSMDMPPPARLPAGK